MNPITNTKNQNLMNERELHLGYSGKSSSWHRQYKDSAWIFVGGLQFDLTEGDIICVFSQYGEIANINLIRDRDSGKSKGFAFICYENQKSTVLATDNLNGIKLSGRLIRVDHVEKYKVPNTGLLKVGNEDANQLPPADSDVSITDFVRTHGCGPEVMQRLLNIQKARDAKRQKEQTAINHGSNNPDNGRRQNHVELNEPSPPRRRRIPSVSPPSHRRISPLPSHPPKSRFLVQPLQHRRSPLVSPRQKQSPLPSPPRRKRLPTISPSRRKQSPSVSVSRRKQSPSMSPPRRKRSPLIPLPRRKRSPLSPVYRKRFPSVSPPRIRKKTPTVSPTQEQSLNSSVLHPKRSPTPPRRERLPMPSLLHWNPSPVLSPPHRDLSPGHLSPAIRNQSSRRRRIRPPSK